MVATVEPADTTDTVTWDTGRSDVATVDSTGKITAVAPGTAVIAARAGEKSAFCTVTVVAAPCTHTNKTNVSEKPSTCKEQGWEAYSKCNDCGQLFDKDGNEISAIPYLSLAAHSPVSYTHLYIYLADRANKDGECWPAIPTIAAELKLSQSTVHRALRDLRKAGLLETEQRYRTKGGKSSLLYKIQRG